MIPWLQDPGGRRNPESMSRVLMPWALALYRVVGRYGGSVEDAGEVIHDSIKNLRTHPAADAQLDGSRHHKGESAGEGPLVRREPLSRQLDL